MINYPNIVAKVWIVILIMLVVKFRSRLFKIWHLIVTWFSVVKFRLTIIEKFRIRIRSVSPSNRYVNVWAHFLQFHILFFSTWRLWISHVIDFCCLIGWMNTNLVYMSWLVFMPREKLSLEKHFETELKTLEPPFVTWWTVKISEKWL